MAISEETGIRVYGYRWVVLLVFAIISILIQLQWLTFAPVAREAKLVYHVSAMKIDLLSMVFMAVFLVMCIPASYVIDTYGIRAGVGIGAVLTGIFSLMKGVFAGNYAMVLIAQTGLAVAQPFIINAATKVAVHWFPIQERATAVGVATLAQFLGIIAVMLITPHLITLDAHGAYHFHRMLMSYGLVSAAGSLLVLVFLREHPPTPPCAEEEQDRFKFFDGVKHLFSLKDMKISLILFFIGLGMFNAISTCIDQISEIKGFTMAQSGLIAGIMLIAGIVGAVIIPPLSDKFRKRKPFLVAGLGLMIPGLIGLTVSTNYAVVLASSIVLGFFLLGAGAPVGFQYVAEIGHPAPESSSQGLLLLAGQISGILFIVGMNSLGMIHILLAFVVLALVNLGLSTALKESTLIQA